MSKSSPARITWSTLAIVIGSLLCLFGQAFAAKQIEGVININQATAAELQLLSGVGPAKAAKIIEYRGKHPFRTVEELGRVKGIGPRTVRKWRPYLTVSGPTTARLAGTPAAPTPPAAESAGGAAAR